MCQNLTNLRSGEFFFLWRGKKYAWYNCLSVSFFPNQKKSPDRRLVPTTLTVFKFGGFTPKGIICNFGWSGSVIRDHTDRGKSFILSKIKVVTICRTKEPVYLIYHDPHDLGSLHVCCCFPLRPGLLKDRDPLPGHSWPRWFFPRFWLENTRFREDQVVCKDG